ncbi:hypothetical protein [Picosynechococcus sp. PCC 8807]|uniref:hypothetical protein n=1 Tax=Picosynechococcus sp. PCC 8807 TaxID=195248 RepID=UPI0018DD82E6|nr:hypothetical protein [Picosynechococcus sp. PCC 8807]
MQLLKSSSPGDTQDFFEPKYRVAFIQSTELGDAYVEFPYANRIITSSKNSKDLDFDLKSSGGCLSFFGQKIL